MRHFCGVTCSSFTYYTHPPVNTAAPMTTAPITEPLFVATTQLLSHPSFNSTQHESVNSTAGLELNQPIDSSDTVALKDLEQVNGGSDVLDQVNERRHHRQSDGNEHLNRHGHHHCHDQRRDSRLRDRHRSRNRDRGHARDCSLNRLRSPSPRFIEPQRWLQPHVSESGSQSESSRTP